MAITAAQVKQLRDKTGAGMMDCKKALTAADGDFELAIENLRKAGIAKAAKKADRATTEGTIVLRSADGVSVAAEVLCETDFVAKNERFVDYCQALLDRIVSDHSEDVEIGEAVRAAETERIGALVTNVGENIQIRRVARWNTDSAGTYSHGGRIGVVVEGTGLNEETGRQLGMQIAAANPTYITPADVPAELIAKEKEIAAAQPDLANKPANIIDKILIGKISKWYTEVCLTKQPWIHAEDKSSVEKALKGVTIKRFIRWSVGEELEG